MVCNSPCFRCCFVLNAGHYTTILLKSQVFSGFFAAKRHKKHKRDFGHEFSLIDTDLEGREKAQKAQKRFVTIHGILDRITGWKTDDKKTRRKVKDL